MRNMNKVNNRALRYMGFIQAFSLVFYCGLIALLLNNGNKLFGRVPGYLGPLLFLTLFATSALVCGLITLYFPFILFYYKKQTLEAVNLVFYTARWLVLFVLITIVLLIIK